MTYEQYCTICTKMNHHMYAEANLQGESISEFDLLPILSESDFDKMSSEHDLVLRIFRQLGMAYVTSFLDIYKAI